MSSAKTAINITHHNFNRQIYLSGKFQGWLTSRMCQLLKAFIIENGPITKDKANLVSQKLINVIAEHNTIIDRQNNYEPANDRL